MNDIVVRTIVPILLLIGTSLLSRRIGIFKSGDERVLSAHVYYFALPALFFINMVETNFVEEIEFMLAGVLPIFVALFIHITLYSAIGFSKNTLYLLILSTIFGSLALFGIPFITFAFPEQGEHWQHCQLLPLQL